jgi:hypothetical protein
MPVHLIYCSEWLNPKIQNASEFENDFEIKGKKKTLSSLSLSGRLPLSQPISLGLSTPRMGRWRWPS